MTDQEQQVKRRAAFAALLETNHDDPGDYAEDSEEDPRPYLSGDEEIGRYVCVTRNWSTSEGKLFYLPSFDSLNRAIERAEHFDRDGIFEEIPVAVVDLDEGIELYAQPFYRWETRSGPQAVDQVSS